MRKSFEITHMNRRTGERTPFQCEIVTEPKLISGQGVYVLRLTNGQLGYDGHVNEFYVGYADDVIARYNDHLKGVGARFTREAVRRGYDLEIIAFVPRATRKVERAIKDRKNVRKFLTSLGVLS